MNLLDKIFDDKFRVIKIILCLLILVIMGLWNSHKYMTDEMTLSKCKADPVRYNLQLIKIKQDATVTNTTEDSITVNSRGITIPVKFPDNEIIEKSLTGEFISILGVFHKEGYLEAEKYHVHRHRRIKVLVSTIPVLVFLMIFIANFKFNFKRFIFENRKCRT